MATKLIVIDGGVLEGGGQILRNAAALSCILGQPITVNNIRAGRSNPGLRPQHLSGLHLLADLSYGHLLGGQVQSVEITLTPGPLSGGQYLADTKTAGSICLLLQAALPCLLYANGPAELLMRGGTNAEMAPQIDFFTWVLQPILDSFGIHFECDIRRRGYFPKGGGEVLVRVEPIKQLKPIDLTDFGQVTSISGRAFVAGALPIKVAQSMARSAHNILKPRYGNIPIHIEAIKEPQDQAVGTGTGIIIMAETSTGCRLAGSALGKRGVPAEAVGEDAANQLLADLEHGACTDEHLQDQLIILMALAKGKSRISCGPVTLHTKTAIHVAQILTKAKFDIKQTSENYHIIECEGIGMINKNM